MGIGGSAATCAEDWQCDPALPGPHALARLFFSRGNRHWDTDVAALLALAEKRGPPAQHDQAVVDYQWWRANIAVVDEEAAKILFDLMSTDPAGRQVNLYEVLSCAAVLSPHLRRDAKIAMLCSLFSGMEDARLGVSEASDMFSSLLLGLHRIGVLMPSPPPREDVENDVCRLLWVLRKHQPCRSDALAFEELLLISELDASLNYVLKVFSNCQELSEDTPGPSECGGDSSSSVVRNVNDKLPRRRTGPGGAGARSVGAAGRGRGRGTKPSKAVASAAVREPSRNQRNVNVTGGGSGPVSAVTASAVLSRREVLEAFEVFKGLRTENEHVGPSLRTIAKIQNAQLQLAVKRLVARKQPLELRSFLRALALSKAPAAFTEQHLSVFEGWIIERAQLSSSEISKYQLDKPLNVPSAPGSENSLNACRRRLLALAKRGRAPPAQAWFQRQRNALNGNAFFSPKAAVAIGGSGDLTLTLEHMVFQGVVPSELATAAARTFGWDGTHVITEGCFLELFVPVAPNDYHSLDFMRSFRRAWLSLQEPQEESTMFSPDRRGCESSWLFEEGEGSDVHGPFELHLPSRPSSAPPAVGRTGLDNDERRLRRPLPLPKKSPSEVVGPPSVSSDSLAAHAAVGSLQTPSAHDNGIVGNVDQLGGGYELEFASADQDITSPEVLNGQELPPPGPEPPGPEPPSESNVAEHSMPGPVPPWEVADPAPHGQVGIPFEPAPLDAPVTPRASAGDVSLDNRDHAASVVSSTGIGIGCADLSGVPVVRSPMADSVASYAEDTFEDFSDAEPAMAAVGGSSAARVEVPEELQGSFMAEESQDVEVTYEEVVRRSVGSNSGIFPGSRPLTSSVATSIAHN